MFYRTLFLILIMSVGLANAQTLKDSSDGESLFQDFETLDLDKTEFGEMEIAADETMLFLELGHERACPIEELRQLYELASSNFEYMDAVIIEKEVLQICTAAAAAYTQLVSQEDRLLQEWKLYQENFQDDQFLVDDSVEVVETRKVLVRKDSGCPTPRPASRLSLKGTIIAAGQIYALFEYASAAGPQSYNITVGESLPGNVTLTSIVPEAGKAFIQDCAGELVLGM